MNFPISSNIVQHGKRGETNLEILFSGVDGVVELLSNGAGLGYFCRGNRV